MRTLKRLCVVAVAAGLLSGAAAEKKLVLLAGRPSHGPGEHEFNAGCLVLKGCLEQVPGLKVSFFKNGWPDEPGAFAGATAVVLYSDGGGGHPFIQGDHLRVIGDLMKQGVGLGCLHYAVEVPKDKGGPELQEWIGGYYEHLYSCNPMWSPNYEKFPDHPITRGVKGFGIRDEWYMHMRFRPELRGVTPLLVAKPSDQVRRGPYVYPAGPYDHIVAGSGQEEAMMWAVERGDGGRGFGFTGGHFHKNWGQEDFRRVVLNAIVWVCKLDVPAAGVPSAVSADQLKENLDPKGR